MDKLYTKYLLGGVAFISGSVVMILELTSSRIVAPYLGNSTIVWTSIIGVILASLSLGYWWGGKMADKKPHLSVLGIILLVAGLLIVAIAYFQNILVFLSGATQDLRISAVLATLTLFAPATIALGMVTPYVTRLALTKLENGGQIIGAIYAVSTVGSIVGTFLGGFVLISFFGSTRILFILSLTLIFLSLVIFVLGNVRRSIKLISILLFLTVAYGYTTYDVQLVLANSEPYKVIVDADTKHSRVWIYDSLEKDTGRPMRTYTNTVDASQSAMYLDRSDEPVFDYARYFDLFEHFAPNKRNVLLIGAGMYTYPTHFASKFPSTHMDIVEIDEDLLQLAEKYFDFEQSKQFNIFHEDGRVFLNNTKGQYDAILVDAFPSSIEVPPQLMSREAVQGMHSATNEDGVVLINIISALEGPGSSMIQAALRTYRDVFEQVYIFKVQDRDPGTVQGLILLAIKSADKPSFESKDPLLDDFLSNLWTEPIPEYEPVLTDDFAPIEKYLLKSYL